MIQVKLNNQFWVVPEALEYGYIVMDVTLDRIICTI